MDSETGRRLRTLLASSLWPWLWPWLCAPRRVLCARHLGSKLVPHLTGFTHLHLGLAIPDQAEHLHHLQRVDGHLPKIMLLDLFLDPETYPRFLAALGGYVETRD